MKTTGFKRILHAASAMLLAAACALSVTVPAFASETSDAQVSLPVQQSFTQYDTAEKGVDNTFHYVLIPAEESNPMPEGAEDGVYSFTMSGDDTAEIPINGFQSAGVYVYTLKQTVEEEKTGYTYDTKVYTVTVYATNADDGSIATMLIVVNSEGEKVGDDGILFHNSYRALATDKKLMTDPVVKKTVTGSPSFKSTFQFTLTAAKTSYPMPEDSTNGQKKLSILGAGTGEFGVWSYDKTGTYVYQIAETNTGISGYTYDTAVYTMTDVISDQNGQLVLSRTVTDKNGKKVTAVSFTNVYKASGGTTTPNTGDGTGMALYLFGMGGSLFALLCLVRYRKTHGRTSS